MVDVVLWWGNKFHWTICFVVESLENISNWNDSTAIEANILLKTIDSEFLPSLMIHK